MHDKIQLENIGSRIDTQTHARRHWRVTSNRASVTVFVTVWPWPLTSGSMRAERLL